MATTQEEAITVGGDSMVGEDTTKVASKTTHPEGRDAGSAIKIIIELTLQKTNIWCSNCHKEGHTKDTCRHQAV